MNNPLMGPVGFSRTVAVKRLHPQFAKDPEFVTMFLDEARLAARIHNPNVVQTLDVVATDGELFLVLDYVQGESLARLVRATRRTGERIPPSIAVACVAGMLHGLHAAHEAKDEKGEPLGLVHRDVLRRTCWSVPTGSPACSISASPRRPGACIRRARGRSRASSRTWRRSRSPVVLSIAVATSTPPPWCFGNA